MTEKPKPEAIPLADAAVILSVCEKTLRRWSKASPPRIEIIRLGPKLLFVPRDEIARLRKQRIS